VSCRVPALTSQLSLAEGDGEEGKREMEVDSSGRTLQAKPAANWDAGETILNIILSGNI